MEFALHPDWAIKITHKIAREMRLAGGHLYGLIET
jgi:hypothetical protein